MTSFRNGSSARDPVTLRDRRAAAFLATAAILLAAPAARAESEQATRLRARLTAEATDIVNAALRSHCAPRCELLEVKVEVTDGPPLGYVAPGFEELAPEVRSAKAKSLDVLVLLDARLPADYRRDLVAMLRARLRQLPAPATVHADVVAYPRTLPLETPPPLEDEKKPDVPKNEEVPEMPAVPEKTLLERLGEVFVEAAPWLVALAMIAGTVLWALWLRRRPVARTDEATPDEEAESPALDETPAVGPKEAKVSKEPPVETVLRRLSAELADSPRLRQQVFRDLLLSEGEDERFARYVQLLGPQIGDGLREDPACRPALSRVAARIRAGLSELRPEETRKLLKELEVRVVAGRLEGAPAGIEDAFSFLDRLSSSQFRQLLEGSAQRSQAIALRFAPSHLRDAALEEMAPNRRRQVLVGMADAGSPSLEEVTAIAEELRFLAGRIAPVGDAEGADVLAELLSARDEAEQQAVLATLEDRPHLKKAVLSRLCTEATLERVDENVLAAIAGQLGVAELAVFVRTCSASLRERFVAALAGPAGAGLRAELALDVMASPVKQAAARREVLRAARVAIEQRGLSLQALNESAPIIRRAAG